MSRDLPILFSGPMVRAVLAGTKTQTRRALRGFCPPNRPEYDSESGRLEWFNGDEVVVAMRCPYGQPGTKLWVREAWRVGSKHDATKPSDLPAQSCTVLYAAGGSAAHGSDGWRFDEAWPGDAPVPWAGKLRPGMFMPRWASRMTLEVTGVRVERLQDISEADAIAEGVHSVQCNDLGTEVPYYRSLYGAVDLYRMLWESINGPGSWAVNPWVWVVEFRRV